MCEYKVVMSYGDQEQEQMFTILPDPRSESSMADLQAQFDFVQSVNGKVTEAHDAIIEIREVREQLNSIKERMDGDEENQPIIDKANEIDSVMTEVEKTLYQTKNRSGQDPLNFPIRLTNKLAHLNALSNQGNFGPTKQAVEVRDEMTQRIDTELTKYYNLKSTDIPELNRMVRESSMEAIMIDKKEGVN